jgi:hypothetical protein
MEQIKAQSSATRVLIQLFLVLKFSEPLIFRDKWDLNANLSYYQGTVSWFFSSLRHPSHLRQSNGLINALKQPQFSLYLFLTRRWAPRCSGLLHHPPPHSQPL